MKAAVKEEYKYVYAGLSWAEYWAAEGVQAAGDSSSSSELDTKGEPDKGAFDVVTRASLYDLNKANERLHIVDGLIKAISILDDVVKTIRASKDKSDAKNNLIKQYAFSEKQAEI